MPQLSFQSEFVELDELNAFCLRVLGAVGFDPHDAGVLADSLTDANLSGWDSHGVARLPHYLRRIKHGSIKPKPDIKTQSLGLAAAKIDGDHGMGHVVMHHAAERAIEQAAAAGAAWVSVCNSSHCGTLSYFGRKIAKAGMVGFAFTHVDPMVVPFNSTQAFCGTNPICIAAPGQGDQVLCLDMATSVTPWNSIENASIEGVDIPSGWAVDEAGNETHDPNKVAAINPMAGYKGSGMGLLIDMLCAMLSDSPYGPDIPKMYGDLTEHRRLGGLVGAIDIKTFTNLDNFQKRVTEMLSRWNNLNPVEPGGRVLYPGEPEDINRAQRLADGLPMGVGLIEQLDAIADELGVAALVKMRTKKAS